MTETNRIAYLDSVRGLAAYAVVIYHYIYSFPQLGQTVLGKSLGIIFNGSDAVSIFFVLSGLVLSYKYFRKNESITNMPNYIIARLFRLYPAFLVVLVIYFVEKHWGELSWGFFLLNLTKNPFYFWEEALMVRDNHHLYLPGWTLGNELALSMLIPYLIILVRFDAKMFSYLLPITLVVGRLYLPVFLFHFCLGVLIAYYFTEIRNYDFSKHRYYKYRYWIYFLVFILFSFRHLDRIYRIGGGSLHYFIEEILYGDIFFITGIASAFILVYIINQVWIQKYLSIKPLLFLGKISYSVYLVHWTFPNHTIKLLEVLNLTQQSEVLSFLIGMIFLTFITLISATFLYYFVELPFIRIGKKIITKREASALPENK